MSPVLHGRTFFAAVGIAILGAVAIAAVISIKHPDRRTKPQAAIKQHIALQSEGMSFYFLADYHSMTTVQDAALRGQDRVHLK